MSWNTVRGGGRRELVNSSQHQAPGTEILTSRGPVNTPALRNNGPGLVHELRVSVTGQQKRGKKRRTHWQVSKPGQGANGKRGRRRGSGRKS